MKGTILKFVLLFGLLFSIKIVFDFTLPIDDNFEGELKLKEQLFQKNNPNTIFIGSSRIKGGIKPSIIDSLNRNHNLVTFNFGSSAFTMPYTTNWILENLKKYPSTKIIVLELNGPLLNLSRTSEWWTFVNKDTNWQFDNLTRNRFYFNSIKKASEMDFLNEDWLSPRPNIRFYKEKKQQQLILNGFSPAYLEQAPYFNLEEIQIRNELTKRVHKAISSDKTPQSLAISVTLKNLVQLCEQQKIRCYFLPPPFINSGAEAFYVSEALKYITSKNLPLILSENALDSLLLPKYRFDENHFNEKGAFVYSIAVGKALNKTLQKN